MIDEVLLGRYRIESELGKGGMGIVYKAHDSLLNRAVAVKFLNTVGVGTEGKARLLQEARAVAQLNHPNIVSVYDAGETEGNPFIVMELVKGTTLRNMERLQLPEVLRMARQICLALEHAHSNEIIHRDLKLENIIITDTQTLKLMDFGLARTADDVRLTAEGTIMGTLAYLAPELIQGEPASVQSDLYAFGIILYELLTGQAPFHGAIHTVLMQHIEGKVTPPSARNTDVPAALDELILRLLSKRPEERLASAKDVLFTLEKLEEQLEQDKAELSTLQKAINQKFTRLNQLANSALPVGGNPYLFIQPFGFSDHTRFFGREDIMVELIERMSGNPVTFLCSSQGAGKTSLLKAGLAPALLAHGHLPLVIGASNEPLEASIKKDLLPDLDHLPFLKAMSLTKFIDLVAGALPESKMLCLLVDDFDVFFEHEEVERNAFHTEWRRCFNGISANVRWLFCAPSDLHHLLGFFKPEIHPNTNTVNVPILSREAARAAMIKPAEMYGIHIDEDVITSILDILGGDNIHPAELQLVCYMLASNKGSPLKEWTMEHYTKMGKADGILRDYLDLAIEDLEPQELEPAWKILAVLADPASRTFTDEQLIQKMKSYGVQENMTRRVLADLQESHLIEHSVVYRLSSESLRPRIEKWQETRSVLVRAQQETIEQLQNVRNSALRGLVGGALGFALVDQLLLPTSSSSLYFKIFFVMLAMTVGALAGLLMVFSIDISIASYTGPKKPLAYLAGGISGALSFALAMILYTYLNTNTVEDFLSLIPKAILEGGLWGLAGGAGTVWVLSSHRPPWVTAPLVILLCGLVLSMMDVVFGVLGRSDALDSTPFTLALSGVLFPGFILVAAMTGRRNIR